MRGEGSGQCRRGSGATTRAENAHTGGLVSSPKFSFDKSRRWRRAKSLVCSRVHDLGRADLRSLPSRSITAAIRRQRTRRHPPFDAFATTRDTREDETALDRATDEESASARRF